jgi:hypothetical protein
MAISKLNKLLNAIMDSKNASVSIGPQKLNINTPAKVWGDEPTVTNYHYTGLTHRTHNKAGVMATLREADDWVSVTTTQRNNYKKTVNYAFKSEKYNAVIYVRSVLTMNHTGKQSLSAHIANIYYVVGDSKLNNLWVMADDAADKQKAARKAANVADKEVKMIRNKNWVSSGLREKPEYNVPSLSNARESLWLKLMPAIEANSSLLVFSELLAKNARKQSDRYCLGRNGLKVKEMTPELTALFLDSTFKAISTIAAASHLVVIRTGNTITLSNEHTRENINMQIGAFTGHNTFIKVG